MSDGDMHYLYNIGQEMDRKKKKIYMELGKIFYTAIPFIAKGLKEIENSDVIFYYEDIVASGDEYESSSLKDKIIEKGVQSHAKPLETMGDEAWRSFEDESIDVIFIRGEQNTYDFYEKLVVWQPKLKEDGWLFGFFNMPSSFIDSSFFEALDRFSIERGLGYSILNYPLTKNIFELYSLDVSQRLREIKRYIEHGRIVEARDLTLRIKFIYSHSPFFANLEAELEYQCGNVDRAKQLFSNIIHIWPYHIRAMNNLASIEANMGNKKVAKRLFKEILKIDPNNSDAEHNLKELEKL
ncbi:MAG TPA: hypothetical protein PKW07_03790 [Syntrophorhabdaceae bacterium]|nr:hypothetical protein [Syntrophorhabdaceae bacterium]